MYRKIITGIIILLFAAMPALAGTVQLPKTGQTIIYATGDDGDLEMGVAWPDTRFTDKVDGTVKDNLTGLVWTKNANLPNGPLTWQAALDYVAGMNAGTYENFGYTDWRLPNVNELKSLTDNSRYSPALPQGHPFTNVQLSWWYWSSTTNAYRTGNACIVSMYIGIVNYGYKFYFNGDYAWPVRSGQGGGPTEITLSSFTATPKSVKVILNWSTESEIDNAGFNLYRSESDNGQYIKINALLITAQGSSTQGASYEFMDTNVQNRKTYYYKLEDIDLNGKTTMHGPVSAMPRWIYGAGK
ncbi:MAG: DUF1566 domain-containing protein [Proteobacteria bacterium]|nr:DUF1566 domain-containing protein [Pseudomonadota bacterium]